MTHKSHEETTTRAFFRSLPKIKMLISACNKWIKVCLILSLFFACEEKETKLQKVVIPPSPTHLNIYSGFIMDDYKVVHGKVKINDAFSNILTGYNVPYSDIEAFIQKSKGIFNPHNFQVGNTYVILLSKKYPHRLKHFIYNENLFEYTVFSLGDSLNVESCKRPTTASKKIYSGIIENSLWETVHSKGIDPQLVVKLENIFAWSIDFFRLRKEDRFKVYLKERYVNDSIYVGIEDIYAAFFETQQGSFYAFAYTDEKGNEEYYDEKGNSLQNTFLKAPVKFSRISSHYSKRRFHPILRRWKSHKGTDFAAPRGTPILATANGEVTKSSYTSGNGRYVKIRHNSVYETQYLHMSRRKVKKGQYVKQGQVIGYVGSTGLANGPHVCYRFWKNGKQVDPFRQILPKGKPMSKKQIPKYLKDIRYLKQKIDSISF